METFKEFIKSIKKERTTISTSFVETIEIKNNVPYIVIYAYKRISKNNYKMQTECVYKSSLKKTYCKNLWYNCVGGYQVKFNNSCQHTNLWGGECSKDYYPNLSNLIKLYSPSDLERSFKKYNKYLICDECSLINPIKFVRDFNKEPKIELLVKSGYLGYLWQNKTILKYGKEKEKEFLKWCNENKQYIIDHKPNLKFIRKCIKNNLSAEKQDELDLFNIHKESLKAFNFKDNIVKDIVKYLEHQKGGLSTYNDYLLLSQENNRNLNDRGVLFPRNFVLQHDIMLKNKTQKENTKIDKNLSILAKRYSKLQIKRSEFKIVVANSSKYMKKVGAILHNCVGSFGYNEKMSDGDCIICVVYKGKKIVECCELDKKLNIVQLRGEHNGESEYHKQAENIINESIIMYKNDLKERARI